MFIWGVAIDVLLILGAWALLLVLYYSGVAGSAGGLSFISLGGGGVWGLFRDFFCLFLCRGLWCGSFVGVLHHLFLFCHGFIIYGVCLCVGLDGVFSPFYFCLIDCVWLLWGLLLLVVIVFLFSRSIASSCCFCLS